MPAQKIEQSGMPAAAALRPYKVPAYSETKLPNGLTVVLAEDDRFPLITVRLMFGGGTRRDAKDTPGVAAALAAMLLKGTGSRSARQFAEDLDGIGCVMTATAHADSLTIEASATAESAPSLFVLLSDILRDALLPEYELDFYRKSRRQAMPYELSQPGAIASRVLRRALFGDAGYGAAEPTPQSMDSLERQSLAEYHNAYFAPNNAYLILTGKLPQPRSELMQAINVMFGAWAQQKLPPEVPAPPPEASRRLLLVDRPGAEQAEIRVGRTAPPFASQETLPLTMASAILGASPNARLTAALRTTLNPGEDVHTELVGLAEAGYISAVARVRTAVAADVISKILDELDRIAKEPVDAAELDAAKSHAIGTFLREMESQQSLANSLGQMKLLNLPRDYLDGYTARINAIDSTRIGNAAKKWMAPDQALVVVVGDAAKLKDSLEKIGKFELLDLFGAPVPPKP
jgi:zinc protease